MFRGPARLVGVNFFAEAARRVGPNLTRQALVSQLRTGGIYGFKPDPDKFVLVDDVD